MIDLDDPTRMIQRGDFFLDQEVLMLRAYASLGLCEQVHCRDAGFACPGVSSFLTDFVHKKSGLTCKIVDEMFVLDSQNRDAPFRGGQRR